MPRDIRKTVPVDAAGAILDLAMGGGKDLGDLDAHLATLSGKDFATAAKQDAAKARLDLLATEATLALVRAGTDKLPADPARESGNLATLAGKDFATQATLASLLAKHDLTIGQLRDGLRGASARDMTELWSKLEEIRVSTDRIPASPAMEAGNLAEIKNRLPASLGLQAAGSSLSTIPASTAATLRVLNMDLGSARAAEALLGAASRVVWIVVHHHDGADSSLSAPDQYLQVGTNVADKVPLRNLVPPDQAFVWTGYVAGNVYLTNTAQAGKRLVLLVGVA